MANMQESVWTVLACWSIPAFVWKERGKQSETSIRIASIWGENQTQTMWTWSRVLTNQLHFSLSTNIVGYHNIQVTTASKTVKRRCHVYLKYMTSQTWQIIFYSISQFWG